MTVVNVLDWVPATPAIDRVAASLLEVPLSFKFSEPFRLPGQTGVPGAPEIRGGEWHHRLIVSPGAVQITTCRREGWEARKLPDADFRRLVRELRKLNDRLWVFEQLGEWADSYRLQHRLLERREEIRETLGLARMSNGVRSEVTGWSAKSQRRMVRRIATLDWSTFSRPGYVSAMVTLTYPGDWLAFAPAGSVVKRHLRAFRAWYARRTDGLDMGVWKLEFQERGAPHVHLLLLVPDEPFGRSASGDSFADECRAAWWRIISRGVSSLHGPFTAEHRSRDRVHLRRLPDGRVRVTQGVNIDLSEGARMTDPARIAAYFEKHGRHAGKAYQHVVPDAWIRAADGDDDARPGRWWGYWKLEPCEFSGEISKDDSVELRRIMRSWIAAQGVRSGGAGSPLEPRAYQRTVWRRQDSRVFEGERGVWHAEMVTSVDASTGEVLRGRVRRRKVRRRFGVSTLSHPVPTGYVIVNDAPSLVAQIGRVLTPQPEWPPGKRRPLP